MADDFEPLWNKIDEHSRQIGSLETKQAVDSNRLDSMEKNHAEMCRQLVLTEGKLMQTMNTHGTKLDNLKTAYDQSEGAKSALKFVPTLLQCAVFLVTIILAIRSFM